MWESLKKLLPDPNSVILLGWAGSVAHDMYIPPDNEMGTDDQDFLGVYVGPFEYYLGLKGYGERKGKGTWRVQKDPYDIQCHEIRKFFHLLLKANPNVLSLLWLPKDWMYLELTPLGQRILDNRCLFSSKQAYRSFVGYAHDQLRRMTRYERQGYMGARRKALVERFGYDTKNAAHLIRLLRMGAEFLATGELHVSRRDWDLAELRAIKQGKWTLENVKAEAERLFEDIKSVCDKSPLPDEPDWAAAERLLVGILRDWFRGEL